VSGQGFEPGDVVVRYRPGQKDWTVAVILNEQGNTLESAGHPKGVALVIAQAQAGANTVWVEKDGGWEPLVLRRPIVVYHHTGSFVLSANAHLCNREGTLEAIRRKGYLPIMKTARPVHDSEVDSEGFHRQRQKMCTQPSCSGTMTYHVDARHPVSGVGTGLHKADIRWLKRDRQGVWECDRDASHVDA
jgi:hypothetical protein